MKTIVHKLFLACLFVFLGLSPDADAQVEARVHQVFEVKDARKVAVKIDDSRNEVNLKETYSTVIIVEVIVVLNHASPSDMENLIRQGRYQVQASVKNGTITFSTPDDRSPVFLNGKEAEEYITYNIAIPEYMEY